MRNIKVVLTRLIVGISVAAVAVGGLFNFAQSQPQADSFKMSFVELAGANGGQNNVVFAFDRLRDRFKRNLSALSNSPME